MLCYIYRSNKKTGAYLYLPEKDNFSDLSKDLMRIFGEPEYAMSINLTPEKKLAQEDSKEVLTKLEEEGYYLQLQKTDYDIKSIEDKIINDLQSKK